jgi:antirestriction protein
MPPTPAAAYITKSIRTMSQIITELLEELNDTETPKIYVACLSSYNGGRLHGAWIDCDQDSDEIMAEIKAMLSRSPMNEEGEECEEWAIHSYEGFLGVEISEHEGIERVVEIAQALEEHGEAMAAFLEHYSFEDIDDFEERYQGSYESEQAFTEEHYSELIDKVEEAGLQSIYIDFETLTRDLFISGFTGIREGYEALHIFCDR